MRYARHLGHQRTQTRSDQVRNSAGGYVFSISPWQRLQRFLVLGSETGTYYASGQELTVENATCIYECIEEDARRLVDTLVEFSVAGRAPSQTETLFALALCLGSTTGSERRYASSAITQICRTGSHVLELAAMFTEITGRRVGSSRALASGFRRWYSDRSTSDLCYQLTKYGTRNGWSQGDLIRTVHPSPSDTATDLLFGYLVGRDSDVDGVEGLESLTTRRRLHAAGNATEVVEILRTARATWEMIPNAFLTNPIVWEALLEQGVPMTALLRNLGRLSALSLFDDASILGTVCDQLTDVERIKRSRIHPYNVLVAHTVYRSRGGYRGSLQWRPYSEIRDALEWMFDLSFHNVQASNSRHLLALDVSGSMAALLRNGPLSCREATAAMALVQARTEPEVISMGFSHQFVPLSINAEDTLSDVLRTTSSLPFGATNCSLPMQWAQERQLDVEHFVVYTDSETYHGDVHPSVALERYRQARGIDARLTVVGMTATRFSIADPNDPLMLDVVGFDSATPSLISSFARGEF